jgi:transposase, IS5 family
LSRRPPFPVETLLHFHCLQLWWKLSDSSMEEARHERSLYRRFVGLEGAARLPAETTILRFRHLLEKHELAPQALATLNAGLAQHGLMLETGTGVDTTIVAAPSSTKNHTGPRDPAMHQRKKGKQWHFGMKAHIGVYAGSGLVHTVIGTAANINDLTQAGALLHGPVAAAIGDAGHRGVDKREDSQGPTWFVALQPGKRKAQKALKTASKWARLLENIEQLKARVRAKAEHPFRVVKQPSGHATLRNRGLAKNTARLTMLFELNTLWMARRHVLLAQERVRLRCAPRAPKGSKGSKGSKSCPAGRARCSAGRPFPGHDTPARKAASQRASNWVLPTVPRRRCQISSGLPGPSERTGSKRTDQCGVSVRNQTFPQGRPDARPTEFRRSSMPQARARQSGAWPTSRPPPRPFALRPRHRRLASALATRRLAMARATGQLFLLTP